MYIKKTTPTLTCGLDLVGEVLYGKWKIRILWFIHIGNLRPSELQRKIPDVTRRVLNVQLKELEDHELVAKTIFPVLPPKVEYHLTDFGESLIPLIQSIGLWGDEHQERLRRVILKHNGESSGEFDNAYVEDNTPVRVALSRQQANDSIEK
ncbi:transcriptional regulator [Paraflavitalea soli]|uniref:Transcriptional regulator n=1 Tax=Paraflavitalea soli TaxID=2315862 RepID=A0A3B7MJ67_9BACT|nr:helix-turn-helix domain-containing protein [Paraflavitalea soli]AXY73647.1 transcriptional regulator [Paraflavitalea soli]